MKNNLKKIIMKTITLLLSEYNELLRSKESFLNEIKNLKLHINFLNENSCMVSFNLQQDVKQEKDLVKALEAYISNLTEKINENEKDLDFYRDEYLKKRSLYEKLKKLLS